MLPKVTVTSSHTKMACGNRYTGVLRRVAAAQASASQVAPPPRWVPGEPGAGEPWRCAREGPGPAAGGRTIPGGRRPPLGTRFAWWRGPGHPGEAIHRSASLGEEQRTFPSGAFDVSEGGTACDVSESGTAHRDGAISSVRYRRGYGREWRGRAARGHCGCRRWGRRSRGGCWGCWGCWGRGGAAAAADAARVPRHGAAPDGG